MHTIIIYTIFLVFCIFIDALEEGSSCITPNNENATCINVKSCTVITQAIQTKSNEAIDFARKSQCGYTTQDLVCCGSTGLPRIEVFQHRLLPQPTVCGFGLIIIPKFTYVVYGGKTSKINEFPWMALLKYSEDGKERFRCGGTLIHQRYVLTAAHCTKLPPSSNSTLVGVRLGEYNISSKVDCTIIAGYGKKCSEPIVDVGIERVVNYPNFQRKLLINDISLIRLDRTVQFTDFIRPICLPANATTLPLATRLTLAGWGETETSQYSDVKLKVKLPVVSSIDCGLKHNASISNSQFCAGGIEGKDSCVGDSGGPLMREGSNMHANQWIQEGIVSYGSIYCGVVNTPAVYTRVSKYLKWIVNNLQ